MTAGDIVVFFFRNGPQKWSLATERWTQGKENQVIFQIISLTCGFTNLKVSYNLKHIQRPRPTFISSFRKPPPTIYTMPYAEYHAGAGTPSNRGFKGNETMNVEAMCDIDQTSFVHSLQDEQLCWTICLRGREAE